MIDCRSESPIEHKHSSTADSMQVYGLDLIGGHGGMYLYDLALFGALARHNIRLTWATCDETQADVEGYELWTPFVGIYGKSSAWRRGLKYARGLQRLLSRARRDLKQGKVVIHQQFATIPSLELGFVVAAKCLGIPCVLSPHDSIPYRTFFAGNLLLKLLYRQYTALIAHSEFSKVELRRLLGKNSPPIYLIPHGHYNDSHGDGPGIEKSVARNRLGLSLTCPVILFLGHIKRERGLQHLLEAMPAVINSIPNVVLVIAGRPWRDDTGAYESLIDDLRIRDHVSLRWEYVSDEEMCFYYRAADVAALPYTKSYQSGVCLTAYAFKRPVVASAVGGLAEQVLDGKTGYLVPPEDPASLAEALVRVLSEGTNAEAMGEAGHSWAAEALDWDQIAERTVRVYVDAWQRRRG